MASSPNSGLLKPVQLDPPARTANTRLPKMFAGQPLVEELIAALTKHMETEEADVYPELVAIDSELAEEAENGLFALEWGVGVAEGPPREPGVSPSLRLFYDCNSEETPDDE